MAASGNQESGNGRVRVQTSLDRGKEGGGAMSCSTRQELERLHRQWSGSTQGNDDVCRLMAICAEQASIMLRQHKNTCKRCERESQ